MEYIRASCVGGQPRHPPAQSDECTNQLNPTVPLSWVLDLELMSFQPMGPRSAKGYALPYPDLRSGLWWSATVAQSLTPYPQYTNIFNNFEGYGTTYYQALQIAGRETLHQRLVVPRRIHTFPAM